MIVCEKYKNKQSGKEVLALFSIDNVIYFADLSTAKKNYNRSLKVLKRAMKALDVRLSIEMGKHRFIDRESGLSGYITYNEDKLTPNNCSYIKLLLLPLRNLIAVPKDDFEIEYTHIKL